MTELSYVLLEHSKKYPLMQPCDALKLCFQNEFGGGHLIKNRKTAFEFLEKEFTNVIGIPRTHLYDEIGNGIIRVNLSSSEIGSESLTRLFDFFCASSEEIHGSVVSFEGKLKELVEISKEGCFSFENAELLRYLSEYKKQGYPPVSHSEIYRKAYFPAYRIVLKKYVHLL